MKKAPQTRFSPFREEWASKRFADAFTILPNNTLSRAELSDEAGTVKNVHYGDVLIKYSEYLDAGKTDIPFIASEDLAERWRSAALQDGDVVMADTAEDTTAGKCSEIGNVRSDTIVSGLHTIPLHPQPKFSEGYLGYYMNSDAFHDQLIPLMQGTKVTSISKSYLADTELRFPRDSAEQAQISRLLYSLDQMITFQQRKCEKLVALKAACLDKMFPKKGSKVPELRFAGFAGEWEQHKVADHCEMFNGDRSAKYPNAQDMVSEGIPFINAGDLVDGHVNLATANKITREKYDDLGGAKLQYGDIVYCLRGTLGKNAYIENFTEGTVASSLVAIRPKNIDGRYLFHVLNSDIEYRQRVVHDEGAAQPNLSAKSVSEYIIPVPDVDEQRSISSFLDNLNSLIILHQRKLEKLRQFKQAMMHNMFV